MFDIYTDPVTQTHRHTHTHVIALSNQRMEDAAVIESVNDESLQSVENHISLSVIYGEALDKRNRAANASHV